MTTDDDEDDIEGLHADCVVQTFSVQFLLRHKRIQWRHGDPFQFSGRRIVMGCFGHLSGSDSAGGENSQAFAVSETALRRREASAGCGRRMDLRAKSVDFGALRMFECTCYACGHAHSSRSPSAVLTRMRSEHLVV
eukprot:IDg857t1